MNMNLTKREKKLIGIFIILVIFTSYYKLIFKPQRIKIQKLQDELNTYKDKKAVMENSIKKSDDILTKYKLLNGKVESFDKLFCSNIIQEQIIVDLNQMIKDAKILSDSIVFEDIQLRPVDDREKIKEIKQEKHYINTLVDAYLKGTDVIKNNGYNGKNKESNGGREKTIEIASIIVDINFNGKYSEIIDLIDNIENYRKKILIKNCNIASSKNGVLTGNMRLELFSVPKLEIKDNDIWNIKRKYGRDNPFYKNNSKGTGNQ